MDSIYTGWVKKQRSIIDSFAWFKDDNAYRVYDLLIMLAKVEDTEVEGRVIHRGEIDITTAQICLLLGKKPSAVNKALQNLMKTGYIKKVENLHRKCTIFCIPLFDEYQGLTKETQNKKETKTKQKQNKTDNLIRNNNNISTSNDVSILYYKEDKKKENNIIIDDNITKEKPDEREQKFLDWMHREYPSVQRMREPLTLQQWDDLLADGYSVDRLKQLLSDMDNYNLLKNNKSAKKTLMKWARGQKE